MSADHGHDSHGHDSHESHGHHEGGDSGGKGVLGSLSGLIRGVIASILRL